MTIEKLQNKNKMLIKQYKLQRTKCDICETQLQTNIDKIPIYNLDGIAAGILCNDCFVGLKRFKYNPELIRRAMEIINKKILK